MAMGDPKLVMLRMHSWMSQTLRFYVITGESIGIQMGTGIHQL
jgi:hypothetical protein